MADTVGQADLRGLDVDKLAKGFAEQELTLKRFCAITPTSAREIRWYQKTAGFLAAPTTQGVTGSSIANTSESALPVVLQQSWTRKTSYVRKYFAETQWLADEDINDSDPDVLAAHIRDVTRAVEYQVEQRIWNVLSDSQTAVDINTVTANAAWNAASYTGVNAVEDIMDMLLQIRSFNYDVSSAILLLNALNHKSLITWLIDGKGSSIPQFASNRIQDGVIMEILGVRVVVTETVTADHALIFIPNFSIGWKAFTPVTAATIEDKGIGRKIRVWEEGEALLFHPKSVCILENTDA